MEIKCFTLTMWDVKFHENQHKLFLYLHSFTLTMWDVKTKFIHRLGGSNMFYLNYVGCKVH